MLFSAPAATDPGRTGAGPPTRIMSPTDNIIALRRLLEERFPEATSPRRPPDGHPTGWNDLDTVGVPRGALTEVVCPPGSGPEPEAGGAALFLGTLLRHLARRGGMVALVDGRDAFDPETLVPHPAGRFLWVRCRQASEAVQAADLLLRDPNFPWVILDLQQNPEIELRRLPRSTWYRFQTLLQRSSASAIVLTPQRRIDAAGLRLEFRFRARLGDLDEPRTTLLVRAEWRTLRRRLQAGHEADAAAGNA